MSAIFAIRMVHKMEIVFFCSRIFISNPGSALHSLGHSYACFPGGLLPSRTTKWDTRASVPCLLGFPQAQELWVLLHPHCTPSSSLYLYVKSKICTLFPGSQSCLPSWRPEDTPENQLCLLSWRPVTTQENQTPAAIRDYWLYLKSERPANY